MTWIQDFDDLAEFLLLIIDNISKWCSITDGVQNMRFNCWSKLMNLSWIWFSQITIFEVRDNWWCHKYEVYLPILINIFWKCWFRQLVVIEVRNNWWCPKYEVRIADLYKCFHRKFDYSAKLRFLRWRTNGGVISMWIKCRS